MNYGTVTFNLEKVRELSWSNDFLFVCPERYVKDDEILMSETPTKRALPFVNKYKFHT